MTPVRTSIDVDELHRLWTTTNLSKRAIAAFMGTTENTVVGVIDRRRKTEGEDRWPRRDGSFVRAADAPPPAPRPLPPGASTLPPLRSVR